MAKFALIKRDDGLFMLAHDSDYEEAKKVKTGEAYFYEVKKPRNYKFHRKFFALIKLVFDNQERYSNMEYLRKDLIICSGYYDKRYDLHGVEVYEAQSLSFSSMDEDEFSELYNSVVDTICREFNFDKQNIIDNVSQYF